MKDYSSKWILASSPAEHVLQLSLNRKPVNAFHTPFWTDLGATFNALKYDADVRAIVLCSALDKMFTAGLDLNDTDFQKMQGADPARRAVAFRRHILDFQAAISAIQYCDKPVIAAMHGMSLGLGLDIASACDIRLAAEGTKFSIREVEIGIAADIGVLQRLPRACGNHSLARELAITARYFDAQEACRDLGFLSRVVPGGREGVIAEAVKLATEIASKSPVATMSTKHLLNYSDSHSIQEGLEYTAAWNAGMLQTDDTLTAIQAIMGKKKAVFAKL